MALNNPIPSVMLPVKLITSFTNGLVLLIEVLTTGAVLSATVINVEFCLTLLLISVAYKVKFTTQVSAQLNVVVLLTVAIVVPPAKL